MEQRPWKELVANLRKKKIYLRNPHLWMEFCTKKNHQGAKFRLEMPIDFTLDYQNSHWFVIYNHNKIDTGSLVLLLKKTMA